MTTLQLIILDSVPVTDVDQLCEDVLSALEHRKVITNISSVVAARQMNLFAVDYSHGVKLAYTNVQAECLYDSGIESILVSNIRLPNSPVEMLESFHHFIDNKMYKEAWRRYKEIINMRNSKLPFSIRVTDNQQHYNAILSQRKIPTDIIGPSLKAMC